MKNSVILSLASDPDGVVTATLYILFETRLSTTRPADINNELRARGITSFAFMGARAGIECSFPLTIADLGPAYSLAESADEVLFIAGLEGNYKISCKAP